MLSRFFIQGLARPLLLALRLEVLCQPDGGRLDLLGHGTVYRSDDIVRNEKVGKRTGVDTETPWSAFIRGAALRLSNIPFTPMMCGGILRGKCDVGNPP